VATLPTETARGGPGQDRLHGITSPVCTIQDAPDVPERPLAFDAVTWLSLSDERDLNLRLGDASWRSGWRAAELHLGDQYAAGWHDGVLAYKRAEHGIVDDLRREAARWHLCCRECRLAKHRPGCMQCQGRTRETFGQPHPDDYPGGAL
jgi:hypothetical protein